MTEIASNETKSKLKEWLLFGVLGTAILYSTVTSFQHSLYVKDMQKDISSIKDAIVPISRETIKSPEERDKLLQSLIAVNSSPPEVNETHPQLVTAAPFEQPVLRKTFEGLKNINELLSSHQTENTSSQEFNDIHEDLYLLTADPSKQPDVQVRYWAYPLPEGKVTHKTSTEIENIQAIDLIRNDDMKCYRSESDILMILCY